MITVYDWKEIKI